MKRFASRQFKQMRSRQVIVHESGTMCILLQIIQPIYYNGVLFFFSLGNALLLVSHQSLSREFDLIF